MSVPLTRTRSTIEGRNQETLWFIMGVVLTQRPSRRSLPRELVERSTATTLVGHRARIKGGAVWHGELVGHLDVAPVNAGGRRVKSSVGCPKSQARP